MPFNFSNNNTQDLQAYLKQKKGALKQQKKAVIDIIQPWYQKTEENSRSDIEKKQKQKELVDLGCFIHTYDNSIQITNGLREKPDFEAKCKEDENGKQVHYSPNNETIRLTKHWKLVTITLLKK